METSAKTNVSILRLVTINVNSHYRDKVSLGRQTAQDQVGQLHRRLLRYIEVVLEQQRIRIGQHDEIDCMHGLVERRFALELAGLATFPNDLHQELSDPLRVVARRPPSLGRGVGGDVVQPAIVEE